MGCVKFSILHVLQYSNHSWSLGTVNQAYAKGMSVYVCVCVCERHERVSHTEEPEPPNDLINNEKQSYSEMVKISTTLLLCLSGRPNAIFHHCPLWHGHTLLRTFNMGLWWF